MSFFTDLFKRKPILDPAIFGDDMAKQIDWSPLKRGGTNFKTHKLVFVEGTEAMFKPAIGSILMPFLFGIIGFIPMFMLFKNGGFSSKGPVFMFAFPIVMLSVAVLMFLKLSKTAVFNGLEGIYYKGKKPEMPSATTSKNFAFLNDIYALQLIRERVRGSKSSYNSFELNLVLKNGQRINVVDHGSIASLRDDTRKLAEFLQVPYWDATEYRL